MRQQGMSLWDLTSDDLIEGERIEVIVDGETVTLTVGPVVPPTPGQFEAFRVRWVGNLPTDTPR